NVAAMRWRTLAVMDVACSICAVNTLCHSGSAPGGVPPAVSRRFTLARGQALRADAVSRASMFVIRSGCAKACVADPQGAPHIVRFLLPGDAVGFVALP